MTAEQSTKHRGTGVPEPVAVGPAPVPPVPSGRTWAITTTTGITASGYLPAWAETDPSRTGVAPERLGMTLSDITHEAAFGGDSMRVCPEAEDPGEDSTVLTAYIQSMPHLEDEPEARVPFARVQFYDDFWSADLDPSGVAKLAAQFQEFVDLLVNTVGPALSAARDDWAAHHPPTPGNEPQD